MKKLSLRHLILPLLLLLALQVRAQQCRIDIQIEGLSNESVIMGYYLGHIKESLDTIKLDHEGRASYQPDSLLPPGIYLLMMPDSTAFDFLVADDQNFKLHSAYQTGRPLWMESRAEGAGQTEKYFYVINKAKLLGLKRYTYIQNQYKYSDAPEKVQKYRDSLKMINQEMLSFRQEMKELDTNLLIGKIAWALMDIDLPERLQNKPDARKQYYKKHYFDHIDFSEEGLLRSPLIVQRVERYIGEFVYVDPDSLMEASRMIIEKSCANKETFRWMLSYFYNRYRREMEAYPIIENVWVGIARQYYLSGQAWWIDNATALRIRHEVEMRTPTLTGSPAPQLELVKINGKTIKLSELKTDYTLIIFWNPGCDHCREILPDYYKTYQTYKNKSLSIMAVLADESQYTEWYTYLEEHQMHDWINAYDKNRKTNFDKVWYVNYTPKTILVDKKGIIKHKDLDTESLERLMQQSLHK